MIPPQSLEAVLQLLADQQAITINQSANIEEIRRLLSLPMRYDDFGIKKVEDGPITTSSTSGVSIISTTLPPQPLVNSGSFSLEGL